MNLHVSEYMKALLQGFVECILFFPVLFISAFYLMPESFRWIWPALVLAGYILGYTGGQLFKFNRQFKAFLWGCLVSVLLSIAMLGVDLALAYSIPVLFVASYRGSRMEQISWNLMFPAPISWSV